MNGWPVPRTTRRLPRLALAAALCLLALVPSVPAAHADRWQDRERILGIVDAAHRADEARRLGAAWDRVLFLWQEIQPYDPTDWYLDRYLERSGVGRSLESGLPLVAVVQGTPPWAAGNPRDGVAGVPTGLNYAPENPENHFGRFMLRLAAAMKGRVHAWIIWNEPDFVMGDAGSWWTWAGNTEDLFKVVRTGYRAVKRVDPSAQVVFPATAYWADAVNRRELYLSRVLQDAEKDPEARRNGFYFDAVALNLYCSPQTIYRVHGYLLEVLARHGLTKPIWLTETNCPPFDDRVSPSPPTHHITTAEQGGYLLQAVAMARAAGYARIGWYGMVDHDPRSGILERWGLVRPDGTLRPAARAFQVAVEYLNDPSQVVRFAPVGESDYYGDWPVWRVVADEPHRQRRVQVLWRSAVGPTHVRLPAQGGRAVLVDVLGRRLPVAARGGYWEVRLPPLRVRQAHDPPGYPVMGEPILLVETELPAGRPLAVPVGLLGAGETGR